MIKKATRPTQKNPQGGILEIEAPMHVSNVMLVCPKLLAADAHRPPARRRRARARLQEVRQRYRQVVDMAPRGDSRGRRRVGNPALRTPDGGMKNGSEA